LSSAPNPTELLLAWGRGEASAFDDLMPLVHDELRKLARRHMRHERPGQTLQATALVNEAYLRLIEVRRIQWKDRAHFMAMASRVMRRILVDAARAKGYQKRGGGAERVTFDANLPVTSDPVDNLVAIDDALDALAVVDARKVRVIEMRFFGGLTIEETAAALGVSPDTVMRDWRLAKSWLLRELKGRSSDDA
jgi:RNA polymerase sigma factor (TIGR02999 family)